MGFVLNNRIWAALIGGAVLVAISWIVTNPERIEISAIANLEPDLARGEMVFNAGGCVSCHSGSNATAQEKLLLGGGRKFATEFGTFIAPNISSDPVFGIGDWSALDLANALINGTSPERKHYYPAFPYTSYSRMELNDAVSLHTFLETLPPVKVASLPHETGFPFNVRRALGGWKLLFVNDGWVVDGDLTEQQELGRYLVEGLGHCGECHTERNFVGGLKLNVWLGGAPNPNGTGRIPDITASGLNWSEADIAEYLKTGFTPEYDTAGGEMVAVIENTSLLSDADRAAIAAYLKAVP